MASLSSAPSSASSSSSSAVSLRPRPASALFRSSSPLRSLRRRNAATAPTRAMADASAASPSPPLSYDPEKVSIFAIARAMSFYIVSFTLALPLFATMLLMFIPTYLADKYRRYALSFVNDVWAMVSTALFFRVEVIGKARFGFIYQRAPLDAGPYFHLSPPKTPFQYPALLPIDNEELRWIPGRSRGAREPAVG